MANFTFETFKAGSDDNVADTDLPDGHFGGKDVELKLKIMKSGNVRLCVRKKNGKWKKLSDQNGPPITAQAPDGSTVELEFGYATGSRWVFINGRWYKIGQFLNQ